MHTYALGRNIALLEICYSVNCGEKNDKNESRLMYCKNTVGQYLGVDRFTALDKKQNYCHLRPK